MSENLTNKMIKVGVIIKHPYRNYDWRIDIYEVKEEMTNEEITKYVYSKMLAPFEVMGISRQISYYNKIKQ
tara:strand:+ start:817 stop:1029 length:213 start_codon:yes stop_codon:yes gene_type:complete